MKIYITGCSWIQRMYKQKTKSIDVNYNSYGGQGLWKIKDHLKSNNFDEYDSIIVQLPTPIRNDSISASTTDKFNQFISGINKFGEERVSKKMLDEYKEKIIEINKLHKRVVFFLYNVGGYPLRHPYDFGINSDNEMINFLKCNRLEHLYLSFEGKRGYGLIEEDCEDEEFWEFYHENNPANRKSKDFKKYWSLISPKGVISIDPHPNEKANKIALKLIEDYFIGE